MQERFNPVLRREEIERVEGEERARKRNARK